MRDNPLCIAMWTPKQHVKLLSPGSSCLVRCHNCKIRVAIILASWVCYVHKCAWHMCGITVEHKLTICPISRLALPKIRIASLADNLEIITQDIRYRLIWCSDVVPVTRLTDFKMLLIIIGCFIFQSYNCKTMLTHIRHIHL